MLLFWRWLDHIRFTVFSFYNRLLHLLLRCALMHCRIAHLFLLSALISMNVLLSDWTITYLWEMFTVDEPLKHFKVTSRLGRCPNGNLYCDPKDFTVCETALFMFQFILWSQNNLKNIFLLDQNVILYFPCFVLKVLLNNHTFFFFTTINCEYLCCHNKRKSPKQDKWIVRANIFSNPNTCTTLANCISVNINFLLI